MKKVIHIPTLILLMWIGCVIHPVNAQKDLTIYPMQSIPQSNYNNPALIPDCKFYIGCFPIIPVPIMPSIYFSANNSGFNWSNAVHKARVDSNYVDLDDLIKHLGKKNYLSMNLHMELLSFGFKIKRVHYITLGLYEKVNFRFCYPKDLISMAWYGNSQYIGGEANFNGIGLDWMHYRELALGYSYIYDANWTFGGRAKLLFGMSNIWSKKTKATLGIDEDYYDFTANSGLHINTSVDDDLMNRIEAFFKDTSSNRSFNMDGYDPLGYIFNMKNLGGALDLGVNYKINKQFSVAASLVDLGWIHFKTGSRNFISPDTTFVFEGMNVTDWIRKDDSTSNGAVLGKLVDSVSKIYQLNKTKNPYWAPLNPVIYLSGFYSPTKRDVVSLLARLEIYKGTVHPAFTAGYYRTFGHDASFSINYSYYNRSWFNIGFGGSYKIGPMQFWVTTDNIFSGTMPYKIKNANLHVGCNLIFYYKNYYPLLKTTG
jgi:hypothetical protein